MTSGPVSGQGTSITPLAWQASVSSAGKSPGLIEKCLEKFKAVFSKPALVSSAEINHTASALKAHVETEISKLAGMVPESAREAFLAKANATMASFVNDCMATARHEASSHKDQQITQKTLKETILSANTKAKVALVDLQSFIVRERVKNTPKGDIRPQVIAHKAGFTVIRAAPQIENLVLRGGGAKGIGNAPALVEMENAGMLSSLKRVVGTSAGALTAVCLASGMSAQAFQNMSDHLNMGDLKNKPDNFKVKYPSVSLSPTGFHAGAALETVDRNSAKSVSDYLNTQRNDETFTKKLNGLPENVRHRLLALCEQNFETDRSKQMITFGDLRLLHQLDPTKFKELTLTGWDNTHHVEQFFDADKTPDMPIAIAGRISMSIPLYFSSVTFDPGDGHGKRNWVDGGFGSNMPSEAVIKSPEIGPQEGQEVEDGETRARTLLMTFDEAGKAYSVLHDKVSSPSKSYKAKKLAEGLLGNPHRARDDAADKSKIRNAGPNAMVIFHGDIGTLDMKASQGRVDMAKAMSALQTLETIEVRMNQAYAVQSASLGDAFKLMNDTEVNAIVAAGRPNADSPAYPGGSSNPQFMIDLQLYQMANHKLNPEQWRPGVYPGSA